MLVEVCSTSFLLLIFLPRLQERGNGGRMVLIVVEAVPASSKPSAGVDMRISRVRDTVLAFWRLR